MVPELPDVEGFRRFFRRHAAGRRVERVRAQREILRNTTPQGLGRALTGHRFDTPRRCGKWLICPAGGARLVLHFGMTGELVWSGAEPEPHAHDRLTLELEHGALRLRDQRKLGGAWLVRAERHLEDVTGDLGADALDVAPERFVQLLAAKRGGIKSALMDQATIAGLGNVTVDEILWRARTDPRDRPGDLTRPDLERIEHHTKEVLRRAVEPGRVPTASSWLTGQRGTDRPTCPRCGHALRTPAVSGRTTYVCPACQG